MRAAQVNVDEKRPSTEEEEEQEDPGRSETPSAGGETERLLTSCFNTSLTHRCCMVGLGNTWSLKEMQEDAVVYVGFKISLNLNGRFTPRTTNRDVLKV